jgi:hypothetical protein
MCLCISESRAEGRNPLRWLNLLLGAPGAMANDGSLGRSVGSLFTLKS